MLDKPLQKRPHLANIPDDDKKKANAPKNHLIPK